ncbi:hypothetical protein EDB83DRAFT_1767726 [Lactarius deliciosus]|nr:hypothetical protein EDB83DRAFT_1767726 [Lactarius deliciosus]
MRRGRSACMGQLFDEIHKGSLRHTVKLLRGTHLKLKWPAPTKAQEPFTFPIPLLSLKPQYHAFSRSCLEIQAEPEVEYRDVQLFRTFWYTRRGLRIILTLFVSTTRCKNHENWGLRRNDGLLTSERIGRLQFGRVSIWNLLRLALYFSMSRAPHEATHAPNAGFSEGDYQYPPQSAQNQASNFVDGSGPIFSMYMDMATEEDKKMAENWKADADGILIFSHR